MRKQILDKGYVFSEFTAPTIYNDYVSFYPQSGDSSFPLFKDQLESKLAADSDIINVSLVSINGRVLFDSTELAQGKYSSETIRTLNDQETVAALKNNEVSYRDIKFMGENVTEILVPIKEVSGNHVLVMRYILSFDSFNNQLLVVYRQLALSFLLVFILVFMLGVPFYLNITRPILRLSVLAKKVSEGDLSVRADVGKTKDEIAVLAEDFNLMVEKLRQSNEKTISFTKKSEEEASKKITKLAEDNNNFAKQLEQYKKDIAELKDKNNDLEKLNKFMVGREMKIIDLKQKLTGGKDTK